MNLFKIFAQSIRFRIVFLLLMCLIPPTLGGIYVLDYFTERQLIQLAKQDLVDRSHLLAELMERLDHERRLDTQFLATHPSVVSFDPEPTTVLLQDFAKFHHWEGRFIVFDQNFKQIASSDTGEFTATQYIPEWFAETKIRTNGINRLIPGDTLDQSQDCLVIPIVSPSSKQQIGLLLECIPLSAISRFINDLGKSVNISRIVFSNFDGWIYADTKYTAYSRLENRRNSPIVQKLLSGNKQIFYDEDSKSFVYVLPIAFRGQKTWGLVVSNSEAKIQFAIFDINRFGLIIVFFISIIVAIISWKVIEHSTIPILKLTQATTAIAEGDLDYNIDVSGEDEVGKLAASFVHMQNQLNHLIEQEIRDGILRLELKKGQQIQQDFLPIHLPQAPGWEIQSLFEPARSVSGDFYDAFPIDDDYLALVIGDVCDKGVGAAMFMGLFRSLLRVFSGAALPANLHIEHISEQDDKTDLIDNIDPAIYAPLRAVYLTNNYITTEHSNMAMFATLFFGVLNIRTGRLTYINAGHEPVYIINQDGIKARLKSSGLAVGMMPKSTYTSQTIQLDIGDLLVGYTDGVTDARNPEGKFFGRKQLEQVLLEHYPEKAAIVAPIKKLLLAHIDTAVQFDDITMLTIFRSK